MIRYINGLVFCGLAFCFSATANAGFLVNDWTLDLGGTTGTNATVVSGIDIINFSQAINHVTVTDNDASGGVSTGDTAVVRGALRASEFKFDSAFNALIAPGLNLAGAGGWELTAVFETTVEFLSLGAGVETFFHTGDPGSFLNLYVDEYGDGSGGSQAELGTGLHYDDGDLIASFTDQFTGFLNTFSFSALNGSDNAIFEFDKTASAGATTGVLFDENGDDLVANALASPFVAPGLESLSTAEDFNRNIPGPLVTAWSGASFGPSGWTSVFGSAVLPADNSDPLNFFTLGSGTATIAAVPEPTSMVAWAALACVGAAGARRRRRKTA